VVGRRVLGLRGENQLQVRDRTIELAVPDLGHRPLEGPARTRAAHEDQAAVDRVGERIDRSKALRAFNDLPRSIPLAKSHVGLGQRGIGGQVPGLERHGSTQRLHGLAGTAPGEQHLSQPSMGDGGSRCQFDRPPEMAGGRLVLAAQGESVAEANIDRRVVRSETSCARR